MLRSTLCQRGVRTRKAVDSKNKIYFINIYNVVSIIPMYFLWKFSNKAWLAIRCPFSHAILFFVRTILS